MHHFVMFHVIRICSHVMNLKFYSLKFIIVVGRLREREKKQGHVMRQAWLIPILLSDNLSIYYIIKSNLRKI